MARKQQVINRLLEEILKNEVQNKQNSNDSNYELSDEILLFLSLDHKFQSHLPQFEVKRDSIQVIEQKEEQIPQQQNLQDTSEKDGQQVKEFNIEGIKGSLSNSTTITSNSTPEYKITEKQQINEQTQDNQDGQRYKIKLDYGWKTLLRGMRQCLRDEMEKSDLFKGRHHWNDNKLYEQTNRFIQEQFGFVSPTKQEIFALVLLLNPAKGIIKEEKQNQFGEELYQVLGPNGQAIFRDIFSNNNRNLIQKFFNNQIILKLWPYIQQHLKYEHCFGRKEPKPSIRLTYCHISKALIKQFNLEPPKWWLQEFKF